MARKKRKLSFKSYQLKNVNCEYLKVEIVYNLSYNRLMNSEQSLNKILSEYAEEFKVYKEYLLSCNEKYNLTAICDEKGILYKHFLDSILPESEFLNGANVVEIGSGAGFPSLPLKIIRRDLRFTLIESTGKKCNFLNGVVDKLGFNGVKVLNMRAEDAGSLPDYREKFDFCVARAVARLNTLCEYCLPFVKVGGKFIAYKGEADGELKESLNAIKLLGGELEKTESYELPEDCGKRTVILIKKVCATPLKYPRGQGKERKNPL